jgi:hypothetical protein
MITMRYPFASYKRFGLVNLGQKGLEINTTVGRKEASIRIVLSIHGTSFRGVSILCNIVSTLLKCPLKIQQEILKFPFVATITTNLLVHCYIL